MVNEGEMMVNEGDYVLKGVRGEFYPCNESIFLETYYEVQKGVILWT